MITVSFVLLVMSGERCSNKEVVIITGGSGLIGSAIIKSIAGSYRIIAFDRGEDKRPPIVAEMSYIDFTSDESIKESLARVKYGYGRKISSVIHLAAYYDFKGKPSDLYDKVTVQGTKKLLQALQEFEVEQFIFSSSLLVYKPTLPGEKITEGSPLFPKWDYPESKVKAEKEIITERKKIPALILRMAGVYNDTGSSIPITNHIKRIYEKEITSHFFPGNAAHGNPFVHLDDLVKAIGNAIEKRKQLPPETIINIGEEETLSFEFLQKEIGKLTHNKEWKTYKIPKFIAKNGAMVQDLFSDPFIKPWMVDIADDHMELDISKAKSLLDWRPAHSLRETLPKMISALKADPEKWYKDNHLK